MIDWETGAITTRPEQPGPSWSLLSAGDWAAVGGFAEEMLRCPTALYGELLPLIRRADLAIVNLETVLSDRGAPIIKDGPNLRGPSAAIDSLASAGFHVANLANNHIRDYGREALEDTQRLCQRHGLLTVGAGLTMDDAWAPAHVEVQGTRVAILSLAEHEEAAFEPGMDAGAAAWDTARAVEAVKACRREADVVVCQCHVGTEFNPVPAPRVVEGFRRLADAGASVVVGHHPHVPMGLEEYRGALIAYSLGNFLFDFRDLGRSPGA
jgi:poly-gamma-glutamate synthesis protein (capsule biosynthesis protein)